MDQNTFKMIQEGMGATAAMAPEVLRYVEGRKQVKKAQQILKQSHRPKMNIPSAATDAYSAARYNAATNSNNLRSEIERTNNSGTAASIAAGQQAAADPGAMLSYLSSVDNNAKQATVTGAATALQQKAQDLMNLQQEAARYSQFQEKNWEWNQKKPWEDAMVAASALIKSGKENTFNAMSNIAKLGIAKTTDGTGQDGTGKQGNTPLATGVATPAATTTAPKDPALMSDNEFATWVKTADQSLLTDDDIQRAIALGIIK